MKYRLLQGNKTKENHFVFGSIFLHDERLYREELLNLYDIEVVEPLWNMKTAEVMQEFLQSGLKTIVVTTMAILLDQTYIGRFIDRSFVESFPDGVDICGENGEYHTFFFDGAIFKYPVCYSLGAPFEFSHSVGMKDVTQQTFNYWYADINYVK